MYKHGEHQNDCVTGCSEAIKNEHNEKYVRRYNYCDYDPMGLL